MRVLVVEDERKLADALKSMLVEELYAVDVAYEGEEGLNAAQFEPYDMILLDRMLPSSMDGAEICRTLRRTGCHDDKKCVYTCILQFRNVLS